MIDRIDEFEIDGLACFTAKSPCGGLNGYAVFPARPVKEPGYNGILCYVPVHGGITYAEQDGDSITYGFDTAHHDSRQFPIMDPAWIKGQIEIMIRGIRLAATLENEYLLAEGDNDKRAGICQALADLQPDQAHNMSVSIALLTGKL